MDAELAVTEGLYGKGNATRTKLADQRKEQVRLKGRDRELEAAIAKARHQAAEVKAEQMSRINDFRERVLTDLEKARAESSKLAEQIRDAANRLASREIRASDHGAIVMHGHPAAGGTVAPNEPILDIVPEDRELLAEVRINPNDIKSLTLGLPVKVQLTAYDSRVVGSIDGTVEYVSADRVSDPSTRTDHYLARIRLEDADAHTAAGLAIKPGMPVEARILLSARTPLHYLIQPLSQSYLKAFIQE